MEAPAAERLTCGECGAEADAAAHGWPAYLRAAEREHEFEGGDVAAMFCLSCREKEGFTDV